MLHLGWFAIVLALLGWTLIAFGIGRIVGGLIALGDRIWDEASKR